MSEENPQTTKKGVFKLYKDFLCTPAQKNLEEHPKKYQFNKMSKLVSNINLGLALGTIPTNLLYSHIHNTQIPYSMIAFSAIIISELVINLKFMKLTKEYWKWEEQQKFHDMDKDDKVKCMEQAWMLYDLRQEEIKKEKEKHSKIRNTVIDFLEIMEFVISNQFTPMYTDKKNKKQIL